jgi:hypothetical protein
MLPYKRFAILAMRIFINISFQKEAPGAESNGSHQSLGSNHTHILLESQQEFPLDS